MKDTAIKMYKMKKYFIHNHKTKRTCKCPEIYGNIRKYTDSTIEKGVKTYFMYNTANFMVVN